MAAKVRAKGGRASQSTISDIETGKSPRPRCLAELAEVFGVTEKALRNGDGAPAVPMRSNVREHLPPVDELGMPPDREPGDKSATAVVTFVGRLAQTGRVGGWIIYPERSAGPVVLGPALSEAPRIFKVEVLDEENSPVYEPRDILSCDPDKQPLRGNYCVFVGEQGADGGIPAVLGKLVQTTEAEWIVKPYAGKQLNLPRSTWAYAWVVILRQPAL